MDLPKGTEENPQGTVLLHQQEIVLCTDHAAKQKNETEKTEVNYSRVRRPASHWTPIAEGQVGAYIFHNKPSTI